MKREHKERYYSMKGEIPKNNFGVDVSKSFRWFSVNPEKKDEPLMHVVLDLHGKAQDHLNTYIVYYKTSGIVGWQEEVSVDTLHLTHKIFAVVEAYDMDMVYRYLQGEIISPEGELCDYVGGTRHNHTSISMGDIICTKVSKGFHCYEVAATGFSEVPECR